MVGGSLYHSGRLWRCELRTFHEVPEIPVEPTEPAPSEGGSEGGSGEEEGSGGTQFSPGQLLGAGGLAALFADPSLLRRGVEILAGLALIIMGLRALTGNSPAPNVAHVVRKA